MFKTKENISQKTVFSSRRNKGLIFALLLVILPLTLAAELTLDTTTSAANAIANTTGANIVLTFSENISQNSVDAGTESILDDNIQIRRASNGIVGGSWSGDGTTTLTFCPASDFIVVVSFSLSKKKK